MSRKGFRGYQGGGNTQALSQQAKKMMKDLEKAEQELQQFQADGTAGGGTVRVIINGKYEVESVIIDPQAVDPNDVAMLQDLIQAATTEALKKVRDNYEAHMSKATGGMSIPGMF